MKKVWTLLGWGVFLVVSSCSIFKGREDWIFYLDNENIDEAPALDKQGNIYFGTERDFYSLTPTGKIKWQHEFNHISSYPVIGDNGTIYLGGDGHLNSFDSVGNLKWQYPVGVGSLALDQEGNIYVASGKSLYALDSEGKLLWVYEIDYFDGLFYTEPVVQSDGTILFATRYSTNTYLFALNPDSTLKWKYQAQLPIRTSLAIGSNDEVYFATSSYYEAETHKPGYLYAIDNQGSTIWKSEIWGGITCSPVIASDGTIYIGAEEYDGNTHYYLYAFSPEGELKWKFEPGPVYSVPAVGSNGTLYYGTASYTKELAGLYVFAVTKDGCLDWNYQVAQWVEPPLAIGREGTVYAVSNGIDWEYECYLYAIKGNSSGLAQSPWPKFGADNQNTGRAQ